MFEFIFNTQRSNDDISVAYLRMDYDGIDRFLGKHGKRYMSLSYSHGFNDLFGSLGEDDPVASRAGAAGRLLNSARIVFLRRNSISRPFRPTVI